MLKHLMTGASLLSIVAMAPSDKAGSKGGFSKEQKETIKTIREAFEESRGHDLRITDQSILDITSKVEGFFEMEDTDAQMAYFDKAEEAFKGIAVSDPGITGLVAKMDDAFNAELDTCIEAFIKSKSSTVDIYGQLKRIWTKVQFDECPYPGSDKDDVAGTNYKPDIVEKKAVAGGTIRTVFTDDLVQATPKGKVYQSDIDDATNELKVSGSVTRFKNTGKQKLRDILNTAKQQRDAMRAMFRRAIQLHHKLSAIEGMPLVKLSWIPGTNDKCPVVPKNYGGKETFKVTRSPKPFWLEALDSDGNVVPNSGKEFSAAQIIAFDPTWALAQPDHGTMADLIDSGKPDEPDDSEKAKAMSDDDMDLAVVTVWNKLSNRETMAALRTRVLAPDNDDIREAYCAMYLMLKPVYDASKAWYNERLDGTEETGTRKVA